MAQSIRLVELTPMEFRISGHKKGRRYKAIVWFRDLKINRFSTKHRGVLDQRSIDYILRDIKTKERIFTAQNSDNLLYWQYPNKPLIVIDLRERQPIIGTTEGNIEHFGMRRCQIEASIVLKILKNYGFAEFRRVTLSTYRLGNTREQRIKVIDAFESMFKKEDKQNA
jgi:hypothetical protein